MPRVLPRDGTNQGAGSRGPYDAHIERHKLPCVLESNPHLFELRGVRPMRVRLQQRPVRRRPAIAQETRYPPCEGTRLRLSFNRTSRREPIRASRLPSCWRRQIRELLSWRYHEYANGFKSAAKDLVS